MRAARFIPFVLLAACGQRQPASDSTAALQVDTMRPVVVDSAPVDSVATPAQSSSTGAKAATKTAPTTTTTTKRDSLSPNIGRDSVIRPKGRMPAIDTPTRRP